MKEAIRTELQAHIATMRQHLLATEQALEGDSLSDLLLCVTDLMNEIMQAGDLAKAEIQGD